MILNLIYASANQGMNSSIIIIVKDYKIKAIHCEYKRMYIAYSFDILIQLHFSLTDCEMIKFNVN